MPPLQYCYITIYLRIFQPIPNLILSQGLVSLRSILAEGHSLITAKGCREQRTLKPLKIATIINYLLLI